jgi:LacI family transcriptional regulator
MRQTRNATIKDVAERANVSLMTVSRVVNGSPKVRDETRKLVLSVIEELNYAPNLTARSLAKSEQTRIAILYGTQTSAYLSEFLLGSLNEATKAHAQLNVVKWEEGTPEAARRSIDQLIESNPTGVVLPPPFSEQSAIFERLKREGIPAVAVSSGRPREGLSSVRMNGREAAQEMTEYLLGLGHRRLGFINGPPNQTASAERLAGFQAAIAGVEGAEALVAPGDFSFEAGLAAAELLLDGPNPPSAIFAGNDDMAAGAMTVAHRRGLTMPGQLTVVGFDDTAVATTLWPALTTIRQPISEMASAAIRLLLEEIETGRAGGEIGQTDLIVPYAMVERFSAAAPS